MKQSMHKNFAATNDLRGTVAAGIALIVLSACGVEQQPPAAAPTPVNESETMRAAPSLSSADNTTAPLEHPTEVYFGDTHLHTSNSGDAFAYGARLSPDQAYRFARGERVMSSTGQSAILEKPLDFLVVADHAEGLGILQSLQNGNESLIGDPQMARWSEMLNQGGRQAHLATREIIRGLADKTLPPIISDPVKAAPFARSIWQQYIQTADRFNQPGEFTALIGYEYTSQPKGNNLHRVVVLRDGAEQAGKVLPFSSVRSDNPEDLWAALQKYEQKTGGKALAIPHNPNLSNGNMFALVDFAGQQLDADYANRRARWEPLVEVTQIKGNSEAHPFLSPNDEYAGFGVSGWEQGNLTLQTAKTEEMLAGDYAREALKRGLLVQQQTGTNPFKFGMIGSTDSHTGLATGDENNFFGKNVQMEPGPERAMKIYKQAEAGAIYGWQYLAGGYAAVWAQENTRAALFDAMHRREVYATTGPRIRLRFFGGYEYSPQMSSLADIAPEGYRLGVPMGGDLPPSKVGQAPAFLLSALKDPDGLNLALLQIVKGWVEADGTMSEQVYDVKASAHESGSAELKAYWRDPDFSTAVSAFYYVRVLEVPGSRWPLFDLQRYGAEVPEQARAAVQERAYSSPIWYTAR